MLGNGIDLVMMSFYAQPGPHHVNQQRYRIKMVSADANTVDRATNTLHQTIFTRPGRDRFQPHEKKVTLFEKR